MSGHKLFSACILIGLTAAACGGGGTPTPSVVIVKAATSGDAQHAAVTTLLALPLQVKVTEDGAPKVGSTVIWSTSAAGSIVTPGGVTDADGIAAATVTLGTVSGPDTIRASLSGASGSPVRFVVIADPGDPTKLGFTVAPSNVLHGGVFTPTVKVAVQDSHGNTVTDATNAITLAIGTNPAAGTLTGGGPVTAAAGVASFTTLSIDQIGAGYTLTATAGGLTAVTSGAFNVTATPPLPTAITITVGPGLLFRSVTNNSTGPAVDMLAVGGTVTWTKSGGSHNVQSIGLPSFPSSYGANPTNTVMGASYSAVFNTAGTYRYDCGIHTTDMTGRIIVQ
ncbi:MAG: hypothetical protein ABJC74_15915 [Gemmatimonadota bacterium]